MSLINFATNFAIPVSYTHLDVYKRQGYIYYKDSNSRQGNRTTYLTPEFITSENLRYEKWRDKFSSQDYGFINYRKDLNNLEILVLEINPVQNNLKDEDIIKTYLSKWFKEMGVKKFELYNSDLPDKTKTRIEKFIN